MYRILFVQLRNKPKLKCDSPAPQGEGEDCADDIDNVAWIARGLGGDAHEAPTLGFEMNLPHSVVFWPAGKIMHAAINFYRHPRLANRALKRRRRARRQARVGRIFAGEWAECPAAIFKHVPPPVE